MLHLIAEHGEAIVSLVVTVLGTIMSRFFWSKLKGDRARNVLQRAYAEVMDAVLLVSQTYVSEIKRHSADGVLTEDERHEARRRAVETVLKNLGETGVARLGRVLGLRPTEWIEQKTEATIAALKTGAVSAASHAPPRVPSVSATLRAVGPS